MINRKSVMLFSAIMFAAPSWAQNNSLQEDDTWIEISGTIESVSPNEFEVSYGDDTITVEMDDGDRDADAYKLVQGDEVTVYGFIDDEFFDAQSMEASSVYVEDIGTYFYAHDMDDEFPVTSVNAAIDVSYTVVQGTVTEIDEEAEEFSINTGSRRLTVDVDEMPYNPLNGEGYGMLNVGDMVSVTGELDRRLFEGRVLEADTVVSFFDR